MTVQFNSFEAKLIYEAKKFWFEYKSHRWYLRDGDSSLLLRFSKIVYLRVMITQQSSDEVYILSKANVIGTCCVVVDWISLCRRMF